MKKQTVKVLLIFLLILAMVGIFSALSYYFKRIPKNPENLIGNTAGNINNKGLFCESEGKIYFSNAYDNGTLYVMNADGSNIQKLNDAHSSFITAGGNYLYYYQQGIDKENGMGYIRNTIGLCRMKKNGSRIVAFNRNVIFSMQLIGNSIYYLSSNEKGPLFYKVSTDNKEPVLLADYSVNPACAADGYIYYNGTLDNHYLYALDTRTDVSTEIWQGNLWYPIVDGSYVYYLDVPNNYRLCRYDRTNETIQVLTEDRVDCYNLGQGYIYYQKNSETEPALKRMRYDGSEAEIVADGNYTAVNITSDYVYFQSFASPVPMYRTPTAGNVNVTTFDAAREAVPKQ